MNRAKRRINVLLEPVMLSGAMRTLDRTLRAVSDKDVAICLIGESGSGKEVLARRIHDLSGRRASPFAPINCAAIPETLFESEVFGHERGAFTGANQRARGKIEAAEGGTLFLDEIGELPLAMQAKLLRFLENRRFMRVGGTAKIEADVRLVCATLRPLQDDVRRGTFRQDLFYRIQGITLTIPPLRERLADLGPLVAQLISVLTARHRVAAPRITRVVMALFRAYAWPGNIRELRNVLEQLCLLRPGRLARPKDLPIDLQAVDAQPHAFRAATPVTEVRLDRPLHETIDRIISAAVEFEGGNRSRAAERLGIGLRTVQRRLKEVRA